MEALRKPVGRGASARASRPWGVTDRPGHDRRYAIDWSRLRDELGWQPRYRDFRSGLAATIDWYRTHEEWWRPQKSATEARYARSEKVL